MIPRTAGHHAVLELRRGQMRHFIIRPANFEAEHRLLIFSFQQYGVLQMFAQIHGVL
eukprot:CAMPEP_0196809174 /NCGR_PEP_ID=MMETSP1362-20130617/9143_1 /TAXON_ID=163516 /ORGANISM="Leptocylindrus danicus, Strain CCMP1856" /LENGTH=56 /DNA_ID=CAMNT_0042183775 /DNA_START=262 /DNA_END=432 /DNA_ORIENTATION=+